MGLANGRGIRLVMGATLYLERVNDAHSPDKWVCHDGFIEFALASERVFVETSIIQL